MSDELEKMMTAFADRTRKAGEMRWQTWVWLAVATGIGALWTIYR